MPVHIGDDLFYYIAVTPRHELHVSTPTVDRSGLLPNTFGVELEMGEYMPPEHLRQFVRNRVAQRYPNERFERFSLEEWNRDGSTWDFKRDSSCGLEVTSPALTWERAWHIDVIAGACYAAGCRTNERCGLHVHHAISGVTEKQLRRIFLAWGAFEPILMGVVTTNRRHNSYCYGLVNNAGSWTALKRQVTPVTRFPSYAQGNRYRSLNLSHWWRTGRVEVRLHHGTLRGTDIRAWILLTQEFIHAATECKLSTSERMAALPLAQQYREFIALITGRSIHADVQALPDMLRVWALRRQGLTLEAA